MRLCQYPQAFSQFCHLFYATMGFYKRELPCIIKLLEENSLSPKIIVIDGYVYLDGHSRPGLGKHLYDCLNSSPKIVGVAKSAFIGIDQKHQIFRGNSSNPLYVTSIGQSLDLSKENIQSMHGEHRIPKLLKRADQLCRQGA